jgi:hypothetical protein
MNSEHITTPRRSWQEADPQAACCERDGTRWYGFQLLADKPSLKYFTEDALKPLNPHMAAAPVYTCEPKPALEVYPRAVFLGLADYILRQATYRVVCKLAYPEAELLVMAA